MLIRLLCNKNATSPTPQHNSKNFPKQERKKLLAITSEKHEKELSLAKLLQRAGQHLLVADCRGGANISLKAATDAGSRWGGHFNFKKPKKYCFVCSTLEELEKGLFLESDLERRPVRLAEHGRKEPWGQWHKTNFLSFTLGFKVFLVRFRVL